MQLENLGFEDTNVDPTSKTLDKNTQANENAVKQSDCSTKSYKLPLPKELDEPKVTIVGETKTEEPHPNSYLPWDKGFSNRYKYCKEVIQPFLQDHPPDFPDSKELLLRDGVVKSNAEFPESFPSYESPKPYPIPTCLPPPSPPPCPPPCPPPKCPSPCPPRCPPKCPPRCPPKCPSPCPPKCPPPKCSPPKNRLKLFCGTEGPTISKECTRATCPSYKCPNPYRPPPCASCPPPCPPCPPPCPRPAPNPPRSPKKGPSSNSHCLASCNQEKSSFDKLLQAFKTFTGETVVCKCGRMPCPPPQCPPPCPPRQCPPPCPPPQCPRPCSASQCPPPCPPPQCPRPCPTSQCPPPCPPPQCPRPCSASQCPPPCPPPQCPPPQCPPPCPPPQCPPPCPPPPCPPPQCPRPQVPPPQDPPPQIAPRPCPLLTIERQRPPGCDAETRSERKFLCPSECPNSKANSKIKLKPLAKIVSSSQGVCTDESKVQSAIDAHHETLATLKCAVTDLVCKAYRSTHDAATIICCESAKQFEKIKKSASSIASSSISSECLHSKDKSSSSTPPKKVSNSRSGTSLRRLSVVNLDTCDLEDIEAKAKPCPKISETNTQSKNPLGFLFDKVESAVSMISESLIFEIPKSSKPRTFNDSSSKYDVPTPPPSKPPSPTDVEHLMFPAGTSQLFSTIKDKIWSMFTEDDKTNVSSRKSSSATLATNSDEDLMTRIID